MNSRSEGFSANKYYFVSIAHKKNGHFCPLHPLNHVPPPPQRPQHTPKPSYLTIHAFRDRRCRRGDRFGHQQGQNGLGSPSIKSMSSQALHHRVRANEGKLPQQMNKELNNQLIEKAEQPGRTLKQE
jgi:hypothetical protein